MKFTYALLLEVASFSLAELRTCGTLSGSRDVPQAKTINSFSQTANFTAPHINVEVYMHSISATTDGLLKDQEFQRQFDAIVDRFAPHEITFELRDITRTINPMWANGSNEISMKSRLRQGNYRALNLYFTDSLFIQFGMGEGEVLGLCYLPNYAPEDSDVFLLDGCTINSKTIPGGGRKAYDLGLIAVHEIGHWFGLLHPFGDQYPDCDGPGDGVADTPASAGPYIGCGRERDSCPDHPGLDPIHNYMDYSDDVCKNEFTNGQIQRIHSYWNVYRRDWPEFN